MSDPAVEAAQRSIMASGVWSETHLADRIALDSAREALKPIRELVENWDVCHEAQEMALLAALKPLIYATEELAR